MTLIPLEEDKSTISNKFRKAKYFALKNGNSIKIIENLHKTSKIEQFLEYFNTLNIDTIILKNLGFKTFNKLSTKIYFTNADKLHDIDLNNLVEITSNNAKDLCTLGHK